MPNENVIIPAIVSLLMLGATQGLAWLINRRKGKADVRASELDNDARISKLLTDYEADMTNFRQRLRTLEQWQYQMNQHVDEIYQRIGLQPPDIQKEILDGMRSKRPNGAIEGGTKQ